MRSFIRPSRSSKEKLDEVFGILTAAFAKRPGGLGGRLPVEAARVKARKILSQFPQGGYMTIVEQWRQLPNGQIEFTIWRLRAAD
jgi:hypothetical protein